MFETIEDLLEYCELCPSALYHGADNCYSIGCFVLDEYERLTNNCNDCDEEK